MGVLKINNGTASQSVSITSTDIAVSFLAWGSGTVRVTLGTDFKDVVISDKKRYSAIFASQTTGTKTLSLQSSQIIYVDDVQLENGNKATDFTKSQADWAEEIAASKTAAENAAKAYADSQDALKETSTKAYDDGIVTAAEQRRITDATNQADAAKTYAAAQDTLLKTQLETYADGKVSAEEQARISQAQSNLQAAKDY